MEKGLAVVFGGSGFIGPYVARQLVEAGWRVRIVCRRPHIVPHLKLSGSVGMVDLAQCNVRNKDSILSVLDGANAAVYLPGLLYERGNQTFQSVHVTGAANVAQACGELGIKDLVHVSALGASETAPSRYSKTKAVGERKVHELLPTARILRPSIVFGPEDDFFNRFAAMTRISPAMPAVGFGETRFQPVFVNDLARGVVSALDAGHAGKTFEIAGPKTYNMNALFDLILKTIDKWRLKLPLPIGLMEPVGLGVGALFRYIPPFSWGLFGAPPLTGDQMRSLGDDNVETGNLPTLADLGVRDLSTLETILPTYLWVYRKGGEFHQPAPAAEA